jgi:hypothetical protein
MFLSIALSLSLFVSCLKMTQIAKKYILSNGKSSCTCFAFLLVRMLYVYRIQQHPLQQPQVPFSLPFPLLPSHPLSPPPPPFSVPPSAPTTTHHPTHPRDSRRTRPSRGSQLHGSLFVWRPGGPRVQTCARGPFVGALDRSAFGGGGATAEIVLVGLRAAVRAVRRVSQTARIGLSEQRYRHHHHHRTGSCIGRRPRCVRYNESMTQKTNRCIFYLSTTTQARPNRNEATIIPTNRFF